MTLGLQARGDNTKIVLESDAQLSHRNEEEEEKDENAIVGIVADAETVQALIQFTSMYTTKCNDFEQKPSNLGAN